MIKIGITGHRNLLNPTQVACEVRLTLAYFKALYNHTEADQNLVCVSALASGADLIFAEEAINQHIPVTAMIPFALDEYKKDFKSEDLNRLNIILKHCSEVVVQNATVHTQDQRSEAYLENGKRVVDGSDLMVAVWNSKPADGAGGTGDIVEYAKTKGKPLYIIHAKRDDDAQVADAIKDRFNAMDAAAIVYKKYRFEPAWISGIIFGLVAVASFAIKQSYGRVLTRSQVFFLSSSEMGSLILSFVLLTKFARRWKNIFLLNRRNAEHLRTLIWYRDAGILIPELEYEDEQNLDQDIAALEKQINSTIQKADNLGNAKRLVWCLAQEQIDYHERVRIKPFQTRLDRMDFWLKTIKTIFFILSPLSFLVEAIEYYFPDNHFTENIPHSLLLLVALSLPSFYAALEGIKYFGEWKRNIVVSKKTVSELERVQQDILDCTTERELDIQTKRLREKLEIENIDWTVRYDEKEVGASP